jgi:predicted lipoprotein with Yx(FWY)xxD motif
MSIAAAVRLPASVRLRFLLAIAALAALTAFGAGHAARAQSSPTVLVSQNANLGMAILTDQNGMTLYTFANDQPGVSVCNGGCATAWPAFQPPAGDLVRPDGATGTLDQIMRVDGTMQVTYNGMPLYYFSGDMNPGDTNGEGIGGVWYAAQP